MVSLPTLPVEITAEITDGIAAWPERATGYYDGKLSPLLRMLLRGNQPTADAMDAITEHDFSRLNPDDPRQQKAAKLIAAELIRLLHEVSREGQPALLDRLPRSPDPRVGNSHAGNPPLTEDGTSAWLAMLQSFPPQLVEDAFERWLGRNAENRKTEDLATTGPAKSTHRRFKADDLGKPSDDQDLLSDDLLSDDLLSDDDLLMGGDSLLGGEPLGGDPLQDAPLKSSPSVPPASSRFNADQMLTAGGWYRDDRRLAIRYRAIGHADPVLKAAIEAAASLPTTDADRQALLSTQAISSCLRCHVSATESTGSWQANNLVRDRGQFTAFSHSPHLNIASLSDCTACHQVKQDFHFDVSTVSHLPHSPGSDFDPIRRHDCATCHTKTAAGDSCVGCHRYHIDPHR